MRVTVATEARGRLEALLEKTSRTFALSIPVLPDPTRDEVTIAYLLFRIADTLEDAVHWPPELKTRELELFDRLLVEADVTALDQAARRWVEQPPLDHAGYIELLGETPFVFSALQTQSPAARQAIIRFTRETTQRMKGFVLRAGADQVLRLQSLQELKDYCYAVAGLVGEMLTELFLLDRPGLEPIRAELERDAATFGEALQLVNILKDAASDAGEGRQFLPDSVPLSQVFALARHDLVVATDYVHRLQQAGAPRGLVEFTALPVLLAAATIHKVEADGAGAKITRDQVGEIVEGLMLRLEAGSAAIPGS